MKDKLLQMNEPQTPSYTTVIDEETMKQEPRDLSLMDSGFDGVNTCTPIATAGMGTTLCDNTVFIE